jgi:hypothetical protein
MISKNNVRIQVTLSRDLLPRIQDAADLWGMTISQYLTSLCMADLERGTTAQLIDFVSYSKAEPEPEEE